MERHIEINKQKVPYTLKLNSRSKSLKLAIYPGGLFTVTAPRAMSETAVERFIIQKAEWVIGKIAYLKQFAPVMPKRSVRKDYLEHKERARTIAHERLAHFNQYYQFSFNRVSIRSQKTRWGSCSKQGNLNFNYKIALLPDHLVDYIIVHELCHLEEFNHSQDFWNLVASAIPNHKALRAELKKVSRF